MAFTPVALSQALPSELLNYILSHQAYPTTLIICQFRANFLASLLKDVSLTSPPQFHRPSEPTSSPSPEKSDDPLEQPPVRHPLLIPTLHQVVTSRSISLVFVPTLSHLRACLATFPPPPKVAELEDQKFDRPGNQMPFLVVYGLVEMHRDTSEWSAQGLGNSLAGLVEAGWRAGREVVVVEGKSIELEREETDGDVGDEGKGIRKPALTIWDERVPMLNGSVRRAGLESEDGGWSGRTVEVGRILGRWFKFRKGDWEGEVEKVAMFGTA